jgi:hypothetical protein
MEEVSELESEPWDEFESITARYNCEVSSHSEEGGGKGGGGIGAFFLHKEGGLRKSHGCSSKGTGLRVCVKCGIVEMSGERAHGFVDDVKSCSRVGSTKL